MGMPDMSERASTTLQGAQAGGTGPAAALDPLDAQAALETEVQDARAERDTPCEFLCGVAGSGKTFSILERISTDPEWGLLTASTGIAAVNLGSVTVHSALGYFDTASLRDAYLTGQLVRRLHQIALEYRRLVIDEVSMVDGDQLSLIVRAACEANQYADLSAPLGLVLVGDFCFGRGTKVTMADGTLRSVEDINVGDCLMGRDFTPRRVAILSRGFGNLYRVHQTNGDDYVVSASHLLVLTRGVDGSRKNWGGGCGIRYPKYASTLCVPSEDMSKRPRKFRECFVGYKVGCISFEAVDAPIDPYFLGLWLGDGDKDGPRITTADPEVISYCTKYAAEWGMVTSIHKWERTKAVRIRLTNGNRNNPLWRKMQAMKLPNNKHIPSMYLYNSDRKRLSLLAGLLDSDGSWSGNRFTFANVNKLLADQVKQLGDQLGFRCSIYLGQHECWIVQISGDTWRIPTRVARKQSKQRDLKRSRMTSVLTVTPIVEGEYFGFGLDGDQMFLLGDGTVAHNCQLPPIRAPWAFESDEWHRFAAHTTKLTKVWRQAQPHFLAALNLARSGDGLGSADLLSAHGLEWRTALDTAFDGTTIVSKNDQVDRYNWMALERVPGPKFTLPSRRWGRQRSEWKQVPDRLELKDGAYVMLLSNYYSESRDLVYANGDCGHVRGREGDSLLVELVRNGAVVSVPRLVRDTGKREKPLGWRDSGGAVGHGEYLPRPHWLPPRKRFVEGQLEYYPVRLAYASTVHKCQGLSLDRAQIDIRNPFFSAAGMEYVSLSRCRTLEGLRIVGQRERFVSNCKTDTKIREWL